MSAVYSYEYSYQPGLIPYRTIISSGPIYTSTGTYAKMLGCRTSTVLVRIYLGGRPAAGKDEDRTVRARATRYRINLDVSG
eukprot:scaffold107649_cov49-Prasinocladus_malaysianus.AAC.1